ncbi:septal ring lytic transglycosylase RlpA family protein [Pontibacter vulgaris]|uniref:septal ring lytic transglycosylase RlpA family protein n=1 Tax=Pontibacter vulgaris TaxID=2905679 RepID=UPI00266B8726|nr:septal ring lytic transglycosylase RlpA family protein [Pontibacter vulgaris]
MNINRKCFFLSFLFILFIGFGQPVLAQNTDKTQTGTASWYGTKYHGRKTSSGERYNKNEMTAAHNGLPFGTKVKVTNLTNNKSVIVRINDRGPFKGERIIDVSEAAARQLSFRGAGLSRVKVEVLGNSETQLVASNTKSEPDFYTIQKGSYTDYEYASKLRQQLKSFDKSVPVKLTEESINGKKIHRIKVGHFENKQEAEAFNELLEEEGLAGEVKEA